MKKLIAFILALVLVVAFSAQVSAATPTIKIPHIEIPDITVSVRENVKDILPTDFWNRWFTEHPFRIDLGGIRWGFWHG